MYLVHKQVLAAAFGGDEAVALGAVEPLASSTNLRHVVLLLFLTNLRYCYVLLLLVESKQDCKNQTSFRSAQVMSGQHACATAVLL